MKRAVFIRMADEKVPSIYGPSADEPGTWRPAAHVPFA